MISNTARYVYEVYRMKSVSLAAEKLYISQPALSAAIKKAEKELGAPIFDRKTLPFSLTEEGKLYIATLEQILHTQQQTFEKIRNIREHTVGTLKIATSAHLSLYTLPKALTVFRQHFPNVNLDIVSIGSREMYSLLESGQVNLALRSSETFPEQFQTVPLFQEKYVVVLPSNAPIPDALRSFALEREALCSRSYSPAQEISDLSLLRKLDFIYSPPGTNLYNKRRLLFKNTEPTSFVTSNVARLQLSFNLMKAGFGALLSTDAKIVTMPPSTQCSYFVLGRNAGHQTYALSLPPDALTNSPITARFVNVMKELFAIDNPLPLLSQLA